MPGFGEGVLHGRMDTWQDGGSPCRYWKKVHMVGGRQDPNNLCWELVNHQKPFHISGYFQRWRLASLEGIQDAAGHMLESCCSAHQGRV